MESIGIDSMLGLMKKKKPLIRKDADSLLTQLKQNSSYLKSPVFLGLISHEFIELVDSFINVGCPSKIQEHFPIFFSTISWVNLIKWSWFHLLLAILIIKIFNVSVSLNVLNDLICRSSDGDPEKFKSLQTSSEIFRTIASVLICPIIGFISDILMNFWKRYKNGSVDVLYSLPCYIFMTATAVGLGISLIFTNIWPTMTFISFLNGLIYIFENMCIVQS